MQFWIRNAGTAENPYRDDDWRAARGPLWPTVNFPLRRRPSARRGDRLVWHAIGSGAWLGDGRLFALGEITSDEPELTDHPRWPWALSVRVLLEVPLLSTAPALGDIGVRQASLRRQQQIRISDEQGIAAQRLLAAAIGIR